MVLLFQSIHLDLYGWVPMLTTTQVSVIDEIVALKNRIQMICYAWNRIHWLDQSLTRSGERDEI